ncbi:MAG: UDP-N-acetylmuramate dehydrogenase [Candidatus Omnitrophica bacterium]|nr:UDP-N-acetylmuramate dehydrogenase [Candidatus Omnitrophota bacterium]
MSLLKSLSIKGKVLHNEPLRRHTTFRIGGRAKIWAEPKDLDDLMSLLEFAQAEGKPIFLIGEGSNLLIADRDLDIMAISLKGTFNFCKIDGGKILCGAGYGLQKFILKTLGHGYSGLEFMAGIPGTVGGAIRMNAGAGLKGPWILNFVKRLKVITYEGKIRYREKDNLNFGYRKSNLSDLVILETEFSLKASRDKAALLSEYKRFLADKKKTQELLTPSAGCVFKNPGCPNLNSARLIEGCGLKGRKIGGAMVSDKHANFIVNSGKATFEDVMTLIDLIKEKVLKKHGVTLETEVEILT